MITTYRERNVPCQQRWRNTKTGEVFNFDPVARLKKLETEAAALRQRIRG